jgi:1-acyl-sn-glycerol-3-phosphate acyltransferase
MDTSWQRPGLRAALLYAVAAGLLGAIVSSVSRVELTCSPSSVAAWVARCG